MDCMNTSIGPITGTFIDEITYDIPSSNWSKEQWQADLDHMAQIGMDTLVFIRGGFEDKTIFPSKTIGTPYADDFAGFIFEEANKRNMQIFFGLYTSNLSWNNGDVAEEVRINKLFIDEVLERYGDYPNFQGWYIPQECDHDRLNFKDILRRLPALCKDKTPEKQVLISPFFNSAVTYPKSGPMPMEQFGEEWEKLFDYGGKDIDICAFQDGSVPYRQMEAYFELIHGLCKKHGIHHWVNAETFERDVRCMYYPIPFSTLKARLELHKKYAEKIITFEFSHFLSPQSIYPSARNLHKLYTDYYCSGK